MADGSRSGSLKSLQSKKTQKNLQVGQSSNPIVFNSLCPPAINSGSFRNQLRVKFYGKSLSFPHYTHFHRNRCPKGQVNLRFKDETMFVSIIGTSH